MSHPYPLRYSIPAVLLLLGLVLAGVATFDDLRSTGLRVEAETRARAEALGTRTSAKLEYAHAHGDMQGARIEVSLLAASPHLRFGAAVDESNRILAATDPALLGHLLAGPQAEAAAGLLENARQTMAAQIHRSPDGATLGAAFSFHLPAALGELRPTRIGVLYLEFDLAAQERALFTGTLRRAGLMGGAALALCLLAWGYFTRTLTRRAARLVAATRELAAGQLPDPAAALRGSDELAQLDTAFHRMADDLQAKNADLRRSAEHINQVLRASGQGSWDWNIETDEFVVDEPAANMLGYTLRQIKPGLSGWQTLIHPDDLPAILPLLHAHLQGRTARYETEYRMRRKADGWVWVLDTGQIVQWDTPGRPLRMAGTHRDITERKQAEEALRVANRETEQHLAQLETSLDALSEGVIMCDMEGNVFSWNQPALAMHGYASLDECRRKLAEFQDTFEFVGLDGTHVPFEQWPLPRVLRGETLRDWQVLIRRKGTGWERCFSYSGALSKDKDGNPLMGVVSVADITARKQAEEALLGKTALLESMVHSSVDGILVVDRDGKKVFQNRKTAELWKIPAEIADDPDDTVQLRHVVGMTKDPDSFIRKVHDLYAHPDVSSYDVVELKDGTILDRHSAPVIGADGKNHGRIWFFHDITERKRAEAAERESRAKLDAALASMTDASVIPDAAGHLSSSTKSSSPSTGSGTL